MDIMTTLFDEDEVFRRYSLRVQRGLMEQGLQQGLQRGLQQGLQTGQSHIVQNMYSLGKSFSEIATLTGLSEAQVRDYAQIKR